MKRPEVEEFKRLTSHPAHAWGMADLDVVHLCDWILHLEAQNASMRRTYGSDPLFREKDAKIGVLRAALQGLVDALAANDEDGLTEFAEPMTAARAALHNAP